MFADDSGCVLALLHEVLEGSIDDRFLVSLGRGSQRRLFLWSGRADHRRSGRCSVQVSRELVVNLFRRPAGWSWRNGRMLRSEGNIFKSRGGG